MRSAPIAFPGEVADVRDIIRDDDRRISCRLLEARRASGVSQQRLGEELGVTAGMIHGYEHGDYRMSAGTLAVAARVVGRDVAWFFGEGSLG